MTSVTQTIDNYFAGISQQPDLKKFPGQVKDIVNGIHDAIEGLYKRPGSKRISPSSGSYKDKPLQDSPTSGGSWFHYYRDETEGSYIYHIAANGTPTVWRCSDGQKMTVLYSPNSEAAAIRTYLSSANPEDIQALTINDTTFLNNRSVTVTTTGTTPGRDHTHFAFIEILRTENGRQYGLNMYSNETTTAIHRATRLKISSDTLAEGGNTGTCPGIGTQVFSVNSGSKKNLTFRITTLGQQGQLTANDDNTSSPSDIYSCSYNRNVSLLHGGEGWETGNTVTVTLDQAKTNYNYTIRVEDHETAHVKANLRAFRPAPTPFDADTAVTLDTILGSIASEIPAGYSYKIVGNGIYIYSGNSFNIEVVDKDLMRVMQDQVNNVADLPTQCVDNYIVKVANSSDSNDDDYYLKFVGRNGRDGPGAWVECAEPGISSNFNTTQMPHAMQRTSSTEFTFKRWSYDVRSVGDENTNPMPSFVSNKINRVLFFRNRLAFLSGENVILSRPGELEVPSFFAKTALAVSAVDPIDISCSSKFPSNLYDGIETASGLVVFSTNQQFLLSSDAEILNPDTAKLRSISTYNYNKNLSPISLGTTVGYVDNSGKYSRFNEMVNIQREQEPMVGETSKLVPTLLEKDIDLLTNSRENQLVLFGKTNSDIIMDINILLMVKKGNNNPGLNGN